MNDRRPVPRIGRIMDALSALVFLAGAAVYARSWFGLRDMDAFLRATDRASFAAVERADALSRLGRVGIALMIAGVVIGIVAAIVARRRRAE